MMYKPRLTNVIGVGQLLNNADLNLQEIAEKVEGSRLNSKKFPGIIIRKTKPKGTVLLFRSNKFIIVGTENQQDCETISRRIAKDIQKVLSMPQIKVKSFKIVNMIASANLGYPVNIARIAELPHAFKDDKSSGVFVKMVKVKCVVVFQTGKIILNGATKKSDIDEMFQILLTEFEQYKLKNFNKKRDQQVVDRNWKEGKKRRGKAKNQSINNPPEIDDKKGQTNNQGQATSHLTLQRDDQLPEQPKQERDTMRSKYQRGEV